MKLYTHCSGCGDEITIKSSATDRRKLKLEHGDQIQVNCHHCGKKEKQHLNKIYAEINSLHLFIACAASVILSIVIWLAFGVIGTLLILIPLSLWLYQLNATRNFNKYFI